jgi:hypothetical protein
MPSLRRYWHCINHPVHAPDTSQAARRRIDAQEKLQEKRLKPHNNCG